MAESRSRSTENGIGKVNCDIWCPPHYPLTAFGDSSTMLFHFTSFVKQRSHCVRETAVSLPDKTIQKYAGALYEDVHSGQIPDQVVVRGELVGPYPHGPGRFDKIKSVVRVKRVPRQNAGG